MNLELIRKYEKEFLHMLHGGFILIKYIDKDNAPDKDYLDWHCDDSVFESNLNYLIVIDDIYSTYRKALAEDKVVQHNLANLGNWIDMTTDNFIDPLTFKDGAPCYRIKPEEPKFKVGDWIRQGTRVFQYSYKDLQYDKANSTHCQNDELWEPREGEVCIFWEEDREYDRAIIGRLKQILSNGNYVMGYGSGCTVTYSNCMPFTGVLPPHMKDNK